MMRRFAVLLLSAVVLLSLMPAVGLAQGPIHVGDIDASSTSAPRNRWTATVTVTVHDELDTPVPGATVSGSWSGVRVKGNTSPVGSCSTDGNGRCSITLNGIHNRIADVTFTVDDVADLAAYDAGANHDGDADSDGMTIAVPKP